MTIQELKTGLGFPEDKQLNFRKSGTSDNLICVLPTMKIMIRHDQISAISNGKDFEINQDSRDTIGTPVFWLNLVRETVLTL